MPPTGKSRFADWSADDLERAAKFMRELDASAHAKAAFELARREQDVEVAKGKAREKEAEASRAAAAGQMERIRGEELRRNMEAKRENERVRAGWRGKGPAGPGRGRRPGPAGPAQGCQRHAARTG